MKIILIILGLIVLMGLVCASNTSTSYDEDEIEEYPETYEEYMKRLRREENYRNNRR